MALVVLIRPPNVVRPMILTPSVTPPLSIAYLTASLSETGHDVQAIDGVGEAIDQVHPGYLPSVLYNGLTIAEIVERVSPRAEVIGVSCMFSSEWPLVRHLVRALALRFPGIPLICGGEHVTALPLFSLAEAPELSACVLGEGEETVVDLVDALLAHRDLASIPGIAYRNGDALLQTPARERIRDVDSLPTPRWDLLPLERYLSGGFSFGVDRGRTMPILATRGCPYQCTFCSSPGMWTTRYTTRAPAAVVDEIERYVRDYGVENIDFYDLTAIVKRSWVIEFCTELIGRGVKVSWQLPSGTRSEALDPEVLHLMFQAGCRNVSYAPESGSETTLKRIKKKVRLARMQESMREAVAAGLNVKMNIIVGFPGEERRDILETVRFVARAARLGVHDVAIWTFSPYPGSELFEQLRAAGMIAQLDDAYFASLLSYADLFHPISYDELVPSKQLQRCQFAGIFLFYAVSYLLHPSRPFRTVLNVVRHSYESRMEMSLGNLVRRMTMSKHLSHGRAA